MREFIRFLSIFCRVLQTPDGASLPNSHRTIGGPHTMAPLLFSKPQFQSKIPQPLRHDSAAVGAKLRPLEESLLISNS